MFLRPLIDELKMLWASGVITYDVSLKQNFVMNVAVMRTINDFPAYGMLSSWITMGKHSSFHIVKKSHGLIVIDSSCQMLMSIG